MKAIVAVLFFALLAVAAAQWGYGIGYGRGYYGGLGYGGYGIGRGYYGGYGLGGYGAGLYGAGLYGGYGARFIG